MWPFTRKAVGQAVPARSGGGWWGVVHESFSGAWQRGVEVESRTTLLTFSAVYACVSIIACDIAKLRLKLIQRDSDGIWSEITGVSPRKPVLRKPNRYQTRIQFIEQWIISRLLAGNAYALLERDARQVVVAMYVLDPTRVVPLVTPSGDVYYQLSSDNLAGLDASITVPASEIIHDRAVTLWHPLVGVSPIYACGSAATQGIRIQGNSAKFFENMSRPSGILTAPGAIDDATAARLKAAFEKNFAGGNIGRLLVGGNGLTYSPMTINATDSQLIEQLKWTVEDVARAFRVPIYKLGSGAMPAYGNGESLNRGYYSETLQNIIESIEVLMDQALGLSDSEGVEFDLEPLLRMDTEARYRANSEGVRGGWLAPNEARRSESLKPLVGGDTVYLQQQQYALEALAKRDAGDPFATDATPPAPEMDVDATDDEVGKAMIGLLSKSSPEKLREFSVEMNSAFTGR